MNFKVLEGVLKVWQTSSVLTIIHLQHYPTGDTYARFTYCASDFSIANGGRNVITAHVRGKHHQNMARACSSQSVTSFFRPQTPQSVIQAEPLRSKFVVAKYKISFQTSDHATKLFH